MELGIINSAFEQVGVSTAEGLEQIKRIGFDTVDLFADPLDLDRSARRAMINTCRTLELPVRSICCVAVGLIDLNPSVQRFHVDRCRQYLDFCAEADARNLLLVLGEYIWQQEVIAPEDQWQWAVDHVRSLGEHAARAGIEIAIELEPFRASLVRDADTMLKFLDDVGLPQTVRANCDISHLYLMQQTPAAIERLGDRIAHVHLSDCNGQVHGDLPPGRGVVPIFDYLQKLHAVGYDQTVSIELEYSPEPDYIMHWVELSYRVTANMLRQLGCRA